MKLRSRDVPVPLKRVVHAGTRTFGRLTSNRRVLPGFLVSGGQRCGTTSMYRALAQHPAILKPIFHKGIHFFDTDYHRGLAWYRAHFAARSTADRIAEHSGVTPLAFESSPYYLYHPLAAERIARDLPDARLLVLVRDPVERARSQHAHERARGFESIADFSDALAAEPERLAGENDRLIAEPEYYSFSHQHHAYLDRGHYADHLDRVSAAVGADRIMVIDSGRFFTEPEVVFDRVLRFLGLPQLGDIAFARHNARPRPPHRDDALDRELSDHYAPHDARLERWLGAEPSWRT
ncbi:sulfotransferase domain-containing protein [Stackebrandtia soli]|uniref:sulfotransferase domain-containing protein n=1 Tax=Stackebrandtia soli TaxID=1892856 RepID=UPI0039E7913F